MHDAIVIGGSFAGLSAAMYLARGLHDVVVLDTEAPRNRFSLRSHGFFTHDGSTPTEMLASARAQLGAYATVRWIAAEAVEATESLGAFSVALAAGKTIEARRPIIASGVRDILPGIVGLTERWGKSVLHCPYCHGYEYAGQRLGVLYAGPGSIDHARMIANWGPTTLFTNGVPLGDPDEAAALVTQGVAVNSQPIVALQGSQGSLTHLEMSGGPDVPLEALYVAPRIEMRGHVAAALGCATRVTPAGPILTVDDRMMTSVPGVYACGDVASFPSMVARAVSDGSLAGAMVSQSLIFGT